MAVAAKGTLNQGRRHNARLLAPDSLKLKILAVFIIIDDVEERIDVRCRKWANKPPTSKKALKRMIRDLAPTSCGIEVRPASGPADSFERRDRGRIQRHLEH